MKHLKGVFIIHSIDVLETLFDYYKKHSTLQVHRRVLFEQAVDELYQKSKARNSTTIIYPPKPHVFSVLKNIAFVMEAQGVNYLSADDLALIITDPKTFELLRYLPCITVNESDGNWMFEHNNIQEFFAAQAMALLPLEKIISFIAIETPIGYRIRPSWLNTLSFLISISSDEVAANLIKWIEEHEKEILFRFEVERIPDTIRIAAFISIFEDYGRKGLIFRSNRYSSSDLARFANHPTILDYLIQLLNNHDTPEIDVNNAVDVVEYMDTDKMGNQLPVVVEAILTSLSRPTLSYYTSYALMSALSFMHQDTVQVTGRIIDIYSARLNQYVRSGMHRLLCREENANTFYHILIDSIRIITQKQVDKDRQQTNLLDERITLDRALSTVTSCKAIRSVLAALANPTSRSFFKYPSDVDVLRDLTQHSIKVYPGCKDIFEEYFSLHVAFTKLPKDGVAELTRLFFEATGTEWTVFERVWLGRANGEAYAASFQLSGVLNDKVMQKYFHLYDTGAVSQEDLKELYDAIVYNSHEILNSNNWINEILAKAQRDEILTIQPVQTTVWEHSYEESLQHAFDMLFDKSDHHKATLWLMELSEAAGIEDPGIHIVSLPDGKRIDYKYWAPAFHLLAQLTRRTGKATVKNINDFFESGLAVITYQLNEIYQYLNSWHKYLKVNDNQKQFLEDAYQKKIVNFKQLWLFFKLVDISVTEDTLKQFTRFYDGALDGDYRTPGSIDIVAQKLSAVQLKAELLINLNDDNLNPTIWACNAAYVIRQNIDDLLPVVKSYLLEKNISALTFDEFIPFWIEQTNDDDGLVEVVANSPSNLIRWAGIMQLHKRGTEDNFLKSFLVHIVQSDNEESEKLRAATLLVDMQSMEGITYIVEYIMRSDPAKTDFHYYVRRLSFVKNVDALDIMFKLLEISMRPEYKVDTFERLDMAALSAIGAIASQSFNAFGVVHGQLSALIDKMGETEDAITLRYNLKRIEEAAETLLVQPMSLPDAINAYKNIK